MQGQDPRGARLAIRARTRGLTAAHVDRALTADRSLVITWLNRGTLHLTRSEDYWWLHPLTAKPQFHVGCLRILAPSRSSPRWRPKHSMCNASLPPRPSLPTATSPRSLDETA